MPWPRAPACGFDSITAVEMAPHDDEIGGIVTEAYRETARAVPRRWHVRQGGGTRLLPDQHLPYRLVNVCVAQVRARHVRFGHKGGRQDCGAEVGID